MASIRGILGHIWGSDGSRPFRLAAWGVASLALGVWTAWDFKKGEGGVINSGIPFLKPKTNKAPEIIDAAELENMRGQVNAKIIAASNKATNANNTK